MDCLFCKSDHVRQSRFHKLDVMQLMLLRYPVRCLNCNERQYRRLGEALALRRKEEHQVREMRRRYREQGRCVAEAKKDGK